MTPGIVNRPSAPVSADQRVPVTVITTLDSGRPDCASTAVPLIVAACPTAAAVEPSSASRLSMIALLILNTLQNKGESPSEKGKPSDSASADAVGRRASTRRAPGPGEAEAPAESDPWQAAGPILLFQR